MIGAGYMTPEELESNIQKVRDLTSKSFGVNLFVPEKPDVLQEEIESANQLLEPIRQMLGIEKRMMFRKSIPLFLMNRFKSS